MLGCYTSWMKWGRLPARTRIAALAFVAAYLLVLTFTPVFHHDFLCHLTSPTHCEACTASPAVSGIEQGFRLEGVRLLTAERLQSPQQRTAALAPPLARTGRAPPA